ncbi:MAG TPA: HAMP domain-containing sensor histidine kinase [Vicinamibacterales bacterium]|nr:HAMP domain-containing sensor histidine kinase [Vicinamibacterales bacterium]
MASERSESVSPTRGDELERTLAELREANERLVVMSVRMQELAEDAEAANRAKDEFLAALSHELRTPLNTILGWLHILRQTGMNGPAADHAFEIIERNAKVQSRLIADLLQVSEVVTGKLRLQVQAVDLAPLVEDGVDAARPAAAAKGINLGAHIERDIPQVLADSSRVPQIIWNLISNAIKFTPRGGEIEITLAREDSVAAIAVRDSGVGIDPDFLPRVFDRFSQSDHTPNRAYGGLGLGLAIVRQLMELHGGTVQGQSSGAGCGSTFTVRFPIMDPPADPDGQTDRHRGRRHLGF